MTTITLKANPIHTSGELPKVGTKAPDFVLVGQDLKDVRLSDFSGKALILSLVPSLDTPTCSISAKKFSEAVSKRQGLTVVVVSADLPFAQKRVCGAEGVSNITTLSMMRSKQFGLDYGALLQDGPIAGLLARAIIVLDKEHRVVYTELVSEVTHEPDYERALSAL